MSAELNEPCGFCGMVCKLNEYHPYAACLMFKACHDGDTVRANLEAVRATPAPGAPAGWINVSDRLPVCNHEHIFIGINTAGFAGAFNAIQEIDGTLYCLYGTPEEEHSVMSDLQWWQRMPAAPGAPGQEAAFPPRILALLHEVADRVGTEFRGPFEDGNGEPLQDDADAALAWIAAQEAAAVQAVGARSEQQIIAAFLDRTGQYVTNDATREAFRVNVLEEAIKACDDVDEPGWTGYECPNTFQDGVSAAKDAIRAKLATPPSGAGEKTS